MVTPNKIGYPKKLIKKKWCPQKIWRTLLRGGLLLNFGKMAYFILYGFINAIRTLGSHKEDFGNGSPLQASKQRIHMEKHVLTKVSQLL